jgi:hypothetical protein
MNNELIEIMKFIPKFEFVICPSACFRDLIVFWEISCPIESFYRTFFLSLELFLSNRDLLSDTYTFPSPRFVQ